MAYRWESEDSAWLEQDKGQFQLAESNGLGHTEWPAQARSRLPDVASLLGAALPQSCEHGAIYPEDFQFCPECGAALRHPAAQADAPEWWGATSAPLPDSSHPLPKHAPHGLPLTALPLAAALESRPPEPHVGQAERRLPVPPNAVCVFAAASFGFRVQRLLALAYTRNVLQYWDPLAQHWQVMAAEDYASDLRFTASDYAWLPLDAAAGRRGDVALVPAAQGLFRLRINPVSESYRTEAVFLARLASAPGAVGKHIACLFADDDGVHLWAADADGANPEALAVAGGAAPSGGWSRPVSYDGSLIWLHEQGHLVWRPGAEPQWLAWPFPWTPRLILGGPVRSRDGRLWLIGHDGQGYSFRELGVAQAQVEAIDGARLGFGTLLFRRGHQVKDEPWAIEDVEDQRHSDALVLPLLENLSSTRSQPTGLVLRFEKFTGKAEAALESAILPRTLIEWIGQRNVILDEAVRLSRPGDCLPFVYDDCLWLHHPTWNEIRGWQLKALA
ncbi:hypothetical protein [Massilia sp. YIM B04103]|uniref:hypothetical protein n=1 Tax=Massilia sp. YIM B04103 TaxID=2963106 RepID=UPI00210A8B52|nr:hypothetical protein [Massilia sp. YIM B04103]